MQDQGHISVQVADLKAAPADNESLVGEKSPKYKQFDFLDDPQSMPMSSAPAWVQLHIDVGAIMELEVRGNMCQADTIIGHTIAAAKSH